MAVQDPELEPYPFSSVLEFRAHVAQRLQVTLSRSPTHFLRHILYPPTATSRIALCTRCAMPRTA
eukprot:280398-Rhodomonas_salina.2